MNLIALQVLYSEQVARSLIKQVTANKRILKHTKQIKCLIKLARLNFNFSEVSNN